MAVTKPSTASTTTTEFSSSSSSHTFNMPATRPDGDFYLLLWSSPASSRSISSLSGWTKIKNNDASGVSMDMWYRWGSSEPSTYTLSLPGSGVGRAVVMRIQNVDATYPVCHFAESSTASSTSKNAPETLRHDNCITVMQAGILANEDWSSELGSPYTTIVDASSATLGRLTVYETQSGQSAIVSRAGDEGSWTWTTSTAMQSHQVTLNGTNTEDYPYPVMMSYDQTGSGTSHTWNDVLPAEVDDQLVTIIHITVDQDAVSVAPSGFTQIANLDSGGVGTYVGWKVASASDAGGGGSYTLDADDGSQAIVVAYARVDTSDPINVSATEAAGADETNQACIDLTTTANQCLVVQMLYKDGADITGAPSSGGDTYNYNLRACTFASCTYVKTTAGLVDGSVDIGNWTHATEGVGVVAIALTPLFLGFDGVNKVNTVLQTEFSKMNTVDYSDLEKINTIT